MNTKKNVFLWVLYDFANSLVMIVFFLYFAQWLVIDRAVPDIYYNLTFTVTALLLLFTVPLTGTLLDKYVRRITGIRYTTVLTSIFYGICALFAIYNHEIYALIFFTLGSYMYLLSFTFYTPLINDISRPEKRGLVSGLGTSANYLGQIAGLLMVLPLSNGSLSFFEGAPRAETLLPSVVAFLVLSLPMLIFFNEPKKESGKLIFKDGIKEMISETKILFSMAGVGFFLLSYFLFNDAILTSVNNLPIYLEQVWGVTDTIKTYLLLAVLVASTVGGVLSGLIADKFGHKRTLTCILFVWVLLFPALGLVRNFSVFVGLCILLGLFYGSNWTVSRSVMSYVAPPGKHNLAFAYYGLAERASSFLGPIVWGGIVTGFLAMGSTRYRIAMFSLSIFVLLALLFLLKVKDDRKKEF